MSAVETAEGAEVYEFSLSYQQQRLLLQIELDPDSSPSYHVPLAVRLDGPLDDDALARALQSLVDRHEALRTTFDQRRGVQVVASAGEVTLAHRDLRGCPERPTAWAGELADLLATPFDLARDLPLRACLARIGDDAHLLVLVIHHIACDAWSVGLLSHQLFAAYGDVVAGRRPSNDAEGLQYGDFADWQQRTVTDDRLETGLRYWCDQLAGAPPFLDVPTDHPRQGPHRSGAAAVLPACSARAAALDAASDRYRASGFAVVVTAYAWVLGMYARQRDVVLGVPSAGRTRPELESVVGCFFDLLAVRPRLDGALTAAQAVERSSRAVLGAMGHAEVPFQLVADRLAPPHDPLRSPVFQAMVNYQDRPPTLPDVPGLRVLPVALDAMGVKYDLSLEVHRLSDGLRLELNHDADLFTPVTARRLLDTVDRVLRWLAVAPADAPMSGCPLLDERQADLVAGLLARDLPDAANGGRLELHDEEGRAVPLGAVGEVVRVSEHGRESTGRLARVGPRQVEIRGARDAEVRLVGGQVPLDRVQQALLPGWAEVRDDGLVVHGLDASLEDVRRLLLPLLASTSLVVDVAEEARDTDPDAVGSLPVVVGCFEKVLGKRPVRPDDHFFRRGGSSLAATRLVAVLEEATGVVVPLRDLARMPTPGAVADVIDAAHATTPVLDRDAWDPKTVALVGADGPMADALRSQLRTAGVRVLEVAPDEPGTAAAAVSAVYVGPALLVDRADRASALRTAIEVSATSTLKPVHYLGLLDEAGGGPVPARPLASGDGPVAEEERRLVEAAGTGVPVVLYRLADGPVAATVAEVLRRRTDEDADGRVLHVDLGPEGQPESAGNSPAGSRRGAWS